MRKFIFHEVGKIFEFGGKKLCFEESSIDDEIMNCSSCALDDDKKLCYQMRCGASDRPDNKNTILKEIQ